MLRNFVLLDGNLGDRQVGTFNYNTQTMEFGMTISQDVPPEDLPLSIEGYALNAKFVVSHADTLRWVRGRICPPGRHNIRDILKDNNLDEYDEFSLLTLFNARCDKDDLYLVEC
ncbi:MAG: hypothetical protein FWC13_07010 [Oscillospiraceae bacterium]|nr:hypothetical protein [Oscillospiraceae bacterium]